MKKYYLMFLRFVNNFVFSLNKKKRRVLRGNTLLTVK